MARSTRPSPALVISLIALFVSLGGTGYAALKITGKSVKDGSLSGRDVKNSTLTGKDVKNRSLAASDLKRGVLKRGTTGLRGATGPPGPAPRPGPVVAVKPALGTGNCTAGRTGEFCALSALGGQLSRNAGPDYQPVGFYRDGWGFIHLEGTATVDSNSEPIFLLPPGFRPSKFRRFAVSAFNGGQAIETGFVEISPTGRVAPSAAREFISLDGISFRP